MPEARIADYRNPDTRYAAQETLIAPARARCELWRTLLGLGLIVTLYGAGLRLYREMIGGMFSLPDWAVEMGMFNPIGPFWMLALLFSFVTLGVSVLLVVRVLHNRSGASLFGPAWRTIRLGLKTALAVIVLYALIEILPPYDLFAVVPNAGLPTSTWLMLLPVSLAGVLVQSGAEELVFRGYLQSQLAARTNLSVIWMGVPAAIFALSHYNPEAAESSALMVMIWAFFFGLLAADVTARSGTLGPAIGFHFANNTFAMLYIGFPDGFGGLALYHLPFGISELSGQPPLMLVELSLVFVSWLAVRVAIRR